MATAVEDLWPSGIQSPPDQLPPITILKQQAAMLGQRTRNLLEGIVQTEWEDTNDPGLADPANSRRLRHTLFLVAPALNFYRYPLLDATHDVVSLYPVTVTGRWGRSFPTVKEQITGAVNHYTASTEAEFKDVLKNIFGHEETKKIIGSLLAQSGEQRPRAPF